MSREPSAQVSGTPEHDPETREVSGIASHVVLDRAAGTATKVYRRRFPIWILYWIAFQAPFPYATNMAALKAAQYRRRIAGLITKVFFGRDVIAPVIAVNREGDQFQFVTALVEGGPPGDKGRARRFLHDVTRAFIETGLPTWQVSPHNPRVLGNVMETADGNYWIIDLVHATVEIHRDPEASPDTLHGWRYRSVVTLRPPATIAPLAAPDNPIPVAELLP